MSKRKHHWLEFLVDPSSGELSMSRLMFGLINVFGGLAGWVLVIMGVIYNMSWCGIPAATIFTGIVASDATVYFGSTRKRFKNDCEE